ncbi:MAG: hypothetical protein QOH82_831 [Mycobacterium sp.]|jgi:hypothetical protein|nr:hypothetical protein [Mycobacterium sp.]
MISLKAIAGGAVIAGALSLAPLGLASSVANAEPSPAVPQVTSGRDGSQSVGDAPSPAAPSPYAAYGGVGVCATPGLYFVNICV